jgi:hypothetical protein
MTTTVEEARARPRLEPVYLVGIELKGSGEVFRNYAFETTAFQAGPVPPKLNFSDRNIKVGSYFYECYLEDLSGLGEELRRTTSGALNADITLRFRNDPYSTYDHLIEIGDTYPFEGALCVIREVYLDDDGTPSNAVTVFQGVLDEPRDVDLMGFTCKVSSMEFAADRRWKQETINKNDFPSAHEDVGKTVPIVSGAGVLLPALRTDWGARTTLQADINASATSCELSDGSRFPASGYFWIKDELISFTRTGNACTITRGMFGTEAVAHTAGAEVMEHKGSYTSLLAGHALHTVGDIFAEMDNRLLRVSSGVKAIVKNGRQLLKAVDRIKIASGELEVDDGITVDDDLTLTNPNHSHTYTQSVEQFSTNLPVAQAPANCSTSCGSMCTDTEDINFPSLSGKLSANYTISFEWSHPCTVINENQLVKIGGITVYEREDEVVIIDVPSPLQFSQETPGDSIEVYVRNETPPGEPNVNVGIKCEIFSARRTCTVNSSSGNEAQASEKTNKAWKEGTVTVKGGSALSTRNVDRFHAVVKGEPDTDGNYGGAGSLIERPDWVIKRFIVRHMGFELTDIDTASFSAAGTWYNSNEYLFAYSLDRAVVPSEILKRLAFECRSTIKYRAGKWYLDIIPDAAPPAVKTISREELADPGAMFKFNRTPVIANDLTARYKRNYSRLGTDSEWDGTVRASDSASRLKYGEYPRELEFGFIRGTAMAQDVLDHILLQRKESRLVVSFPVFYEHFDLSVGDTIEIDNPLWDGKKFYIEEVRREDKFRAWVKALEWWA